MAEYTEPSKNKARLLLISSAIEALTYKRNSSTLAKKNYIRCVKNQILKSNDSYYKNDKIEASKLSEKTIRHWENFYDSIVQTKKPENLKVAYLSGPNPENDLRVFVEQGILPENIWAFESDKKTYLKAVSSALASEFPFIKLVNSGIDIFFEASPQRFDIIYLDFCGPIPSRDNKTLAVITKILAKHAINSLGILITNAALPDNDPTGRALITKLVATYLYPKDFLNYHDKNYPAESPAVHSIDFPDWVTQVENNLEFYYGEYITRLIMDHVSLISPYDRIPNNNSVFTKFFDIKDKNELAQKVNRFFGFDNNVEETDLFYSKLMEQFESNLIDESVITYDDIEDYDGCDEFSYPILWSFSLLNEKLNNGDDEYSKLLFDNDEKFQKFAELFLRQLTTQNDGTMLIKNIRQLTYLLREGSSKYLSEKLQLIKKEHHIYKYHQFCDLVLFHQILELLFRQIAFPYHVNVEKTKRWTYKAKETPMFLDMFVLDECRYIYDWMPTMDMIANGFENIERQLAYRFALDGVSKHSRYYNSEYFFGTAVIGDSEKGFEAKTLSIRESI